MTRQQKPTALSEPKIGITAWMVAVSWLIVAGAPFMFMILTGFKDSDELIENPVYAVPQNFKLDNFQLVLGGSFPRGLLNSILVCVASILLIVVVASMASWAFARIKFRFSTVLMSLVVAGMIVPVHSTLIPIYLLVSRLGIYDTLLALILPYVAFALPISIVILTQFMREIPKEMDEAAYLDGCGPIRTFIRIGLPLSTAGLVTIAIFNAVTLWNEFLFAYVLTSSPTSRTLPLAIWDFTGQYTFNTAAVMAALSLSAVPLILTYMFFQERLIKGMMAGAVKS